MKMYSTEKKIYENIFFIVFLPFYFVREAIDNPWRYKR